MVCNNEVGVAHELYYTISRGFYIVNSTPDLLHEAVGTAPRHYIAARLAVLRMIFMLVMAWSTIVPTICRTIISASLCHSPPCSFVRANSRNSVNW